MVLVESLLLFFLMWSSDLNATSCADSCEAKFPYEAIVQAEVDCSRGQFTKTGVISPEVNQGCLQFEYLTKASNQCFVDCNTQEEAESESRRRSMCESNFGIWECNTADSLVSHACTCMYEEAEKGERGSTSLSEQECRDQYMDSRGNVSNQADLDQCLADAENRRLIAQAEERRSERLTLIEDTRSRLNSDAQTEAQRHLESEISASITACQQARSSSGLDRACSSSPVASVGGTGAGEGSSLEACRSAKSAAEGELSQNQGLASQCQSAVTAILTNCRNETRPITYSTPVTEYEEEVVTVGGQTIIIPGASISGRHVIEPREIPQNISIRDQAQGALSSFSNLVAQARSAIESRIAQFDQCIAELSGEEIEEDHTQPGGGPPPVVGVAPAPSFGGGGTWPSIGGGSDELGGGGRGGSGGSSGSIGGGRGYISKTGGGITSSGGGNRSVNFSDSGANYTGGGVQGLPDDSVSDRTQSDFNLNNANTGGASASASARAQGFSGGGSSGRSFGSFGLGGSSNGSQALPARRGRRGSQSAKARNLIAGFKSVKASDGGAGISIHPSDYKKFGATALRKKLAEARAKHGKDMPLIFKNGKFVLDFLAMKESEMFKNKNAAMEKFWSGGERKPSSVQELHVHQNPKLMIWPLLNYRYRKELGMQH